MKNIISVITIMMLTCMIMAGFMVNGYSQEKLDAQEAPGVTVQQQTPTTQKPYINPRMKRRGIVVIADLNVSPLNYTGSCPTVFTLKGHIYANGAMTVLYKIVRSDNASMEPIALTFEKEERKEITHTWKTGDPTKSAELNEWALIEAVYPLNTKIRSNVAFLKGICTNAADSKQRDVLRRQEGQKATPATPGFAGPKPQGTETMLPGLLISQSGQQKQPAAGDIPLLIPDQGGQTRASLPIPKPGEKGPILLNAAMPQSNMNGLPKGTEELCIIFDPAKVAIEQVQGSWSVIDGPKRLFSFDIDKIEAENALAIIKHYALNKSCFVGSPRPSFHYMLAGDAAPIGPFKGEDCQVFNPATLNVQLIKDNWKIGDGDRPLFDFGTNKTDADQALVIIKKYSFTHSCMMARGRVDFLYLRK